MSYRAWQFEYDRKMSVWKTEDTLIGGEVM